MASLLHLFVVSFIQQNSMNTSNRSSHQILNKSKRHSVMYIFNHYSDVIWDFKHISSPVVWLFVPSWLCNKGITGFSWEESTSSGFPPQMTSNVECAFMLWLIIIVQKYFAAFVNCLLPQVKINFKFKLFIDLYVSYINVRNYNTWIYVVRLLPVYLDNIVSTSVT